MTSESGQLESEFSVGFAVTPLRMDSKSSCVAGHYVLLESILRVPPFVAMLAPVTKLLLGPILRVPNLVAMLAPVTKLLLDSILRRHVCLPEPN